MKILCVVSTLNFPQFTRRATIEAIHRLHPDTELLMFSSLKNFQTRPVKLPHIKTSQYRFWVPEALKGKKMWVALEYGIRNGYWKRYFQQYDVVFFTDPNQYYLLPYLKDQKMVYLIRDPNVLQSPKNHPKELAILKRANLVLATSKNLAEKYLPTYYDFQHENIHFWPNTVDLKVWDMNKFKGVKVNNPKPVIGMAGNLNDRSDLELLDYVTENEEFQFELCGKITGENIADNPFYKNILTKPNVKHLGYIPYDQLPQIIYKWDVGITIEKPCEYTLYTHHNKIYQYLALGKPVVVLRTHHDYDELDGPVFVNDTKKGYKMAIKKALGSSMKEETVHEAKILANENSSKMRAKDFLKWVEML